MIFVRHPIVKKPLGPIIKHLIKIGLKIENHLKLYDYTGHWELSRAPKFLKWNNFEPYKRLGKTNIATYRRFGEAHFFLNKIQKFYNPYEFKLFPSGGETHDFAIEVEALAVLSGFFIALAGCLDSFSIEVLLVCGIEKWGDIWRFGFPQLHRILRDFAKRRNNKDLKLNYDGKISLKVWGSISKILEGKGDEEREWLDQFFDYRNLFAHRPFLHCLFKEEGKIIPPALNTYLQKDTRAIFPELYGSAAALEDIEEMGKALLQQPLTEYTRLLFKKVHLLLESGYLSLFDIYQKKEEGELNYETDWGRIIPPYPPRKFRKFLTD